MKIPNTLSQDLRVAIDAAQRAGKVIATALKTDILTESKGDKGLVTEFDRKAEQVIAETLRANTPYSILGEESGLEQRRSDLVWVVDPIDGTTNFSRKLPLCAVSIALLKDADIRAGVIFNPNSDDCYFAEYGKGAYKNGHKIGVSSNQNPAEAIVILEHGYRAEDHRRLAELTKRLSKRFSVRMLGTTAVELCLVAEGTADAFICSGDELWDYAAGVLLVQEAGGRFTDWHGNIWDGQSSFVFATNGAIHDRLLDEIRDLQPE